MHPWFERTPAWWPLSAAVLLSATGCSGGEPGVEPGAKTRSPIILISLDTLRADRLSLYGYERPTSPELEELARKSTVYLHAQATAPWTLPSHASMLTGLYPYEHGARTYAIETVQGRKQLNNAAPLAKSFVTLAEILHDSGYRTGAVLANESFLSHKWGFKPGFDLYDNRRGTVDEINERALEWVAENRSEPFFLFLNYMDTHRPYNAKPRDGFPDRSGETKVLKRLVPLVMTGEDPGDLLEIAADQYDTAIANLDEGLGQLFDRLDEQGLFERSLIVVTADHGEFLGEHGLIEHAKHLYQEVVHVPLIVKEPGQSEGRVDADWVSHVHLAGLVLPWADVDADHPGLEQLTYHWPRTEIFSENYGARLHDLKKPWGAEANQLRRAVYADRFKYIESANGVRELYDLANDPGERHNLIEDEPARAAELLAMLQARLLSKPAVENTSMVEMTPEDVEEMRAMGYLGDEDDEEEERYR